ncbi:methyltransferase [Chromatium okenii]|uniref:class I SAM-dependent methyltransferase n=1 Tax=Chromatium okenii TaxID=61644 RepID=UPI0019067391|nr:class I SAM-dependent methyltransferase [Chromatium okenii]MBK1640374.1 methyltransferase [Chromatium okenii]
MTTAWSDGYVTDIDYTHGYYTELNPLRLQLLFLNLGLTPPAVATACELGFGQGLSANIHAAAQANCQMWGTDFNPAQAGFAQSLAAASGANAHLFDQSFSEFCSRDDLPDFDYIGLHGIWSWISNENRAVIVDFIRRKLKVGGVFYLSYNALPGWSTFAPLRHLMTEHTAHMSASSETISTRIDAALVFTNQLLATNPLYALANPQVAERAKKLSEHNRHYLAHEYFNRDWEPMHFATLAQWLEPTKLNYACSAHYLDHVTAMNLTEDQQMFLQTIPDPLFRETVRDVMVNQQFRRDYWIKGARRLNPVAQLEQLRALRVMLAVQRADVSFKATGARGECTMSAKVYEPICDLLADHIPKTLGEIELAAQALGIQFAEVVQAVLVLTGSGQLVPVQNAAHIANSKPYTDRLNANLIDQARGRSDINYLASPVSGGGVTVGRIQQLFLLAKNKGCQRPDELAAFAWQVLAAQNAKLVKEGKPLQTAEENQQLLLAEATSFIDKQLPILTALQVVI